MPDTPTSIEEEEKSTETEGKAEDSLLPEPAEPLSPLGEELNSEDAQPIVQGLVDLGMTPQEISEGMEGRVSMRTIYRWMKGECLPQNMSNLQALIDLGLSRGVSA